MKRAMALAGLAMLAACSSGDDDAANGAQQGGPPPMEFRPMETEQGADVTDSNTRLASNQDGERMFNRRCGVCHLGGGMGTNVLTGRVGPENALLASRPGGVPKELVLSVIRHGIGAMPPLTRVEVTDAEAEAIADFLAEDHAQAGPADPAPEGNETQ